MRPERGDWESPPLVLPPARDQEERSKRKLVLLQTLILGSLNVRGCGTIESKREEIGRMFDRRRIDVLALSETKMKGKCEVMFGGVVGRMSGIEGERARQGVGLLLSDRVKQCVIEWKEVNARMMWVKLKVSGETLVCISAYGPGSERDENERNEFWKEMSVYREFWSKCKCYSAGRSECKS